MAERPQIGEAGQPFAPTGRERLEEEALKARIEQMRLETEQRKYEGPTEPMGTKAARGAQLLDMPDLTGGIGFTQGPTVGAGRMDQAYTWIENALAGAPTPDERMRIAIAISEDPGYVKMIDAIKDLQDFGPIEDVLEYSMPAIGAKGLAREWIQKMIRIRNLVKTNIGVPGAR